MTNGVYFLFNQEKRIKSYEGTLDSMLFGHFEQTEQASEPDTDMPEILEISDQGF